MAGCKIPDRGAVICYGNKTRKNFCSHCFLTVRRTYDMREDTAEFKRNLLEKKSG